VKKFAFSMMSILNVNLTRKEVAEMELAAARYELASEEDALTLIESAIISAMDPAKILENSSGSYLVQREKYIRLLNDRKKNQIYRIRQAEAKAQSCAERLKEAVVEVKRMEKARDIEYAEWELEFRREEQKLNDETACQQASRRMLAEAASI